jgi:hypothetical protein
MIRDLRVKTVVTASMRLNRSSVVGVTIAVGVACQTAPGARVAESRCPAPQGEFPPRACAIVRGRAVDRGGRPIASLGLRVDSLVRQLGYAYASGSALTDAGGQFELVVMRINEFSTPAMPDTATVEIKALPGSRPAPGFSAVARAPVRMRFAPLGERVEPTLAGDVLFVLP